MGREAFGIEASATVRSERSPTMIDERSHAVPLDELRHTAAHVLAYAVQDLFPDAKPTIGPAIESGFYYDFARDRSVHRRGPRAPRSAHARDRQGRLTR